MHIPMFYTLFLTLWYVPILLLVILLTLEAIHTLVNLRPKISKMFYNNMFCLTKKKLDMNHDFKNLHPLFKKTEMTQI